MAPLNDDGMTEPDAPAHGAAWRSHKLQSSSRQRTHWQGLPLLSGKELSIRALSPPPRSVLEKQCSVCQPR